MGKYKIVYAILVMAGMMSMGINFASADTGLNVPNTIPSAPFQTNLTAEQQTTAPASIVTTAMNWFFAIAAILCVAIIVWAGITYATAGGDEEKVGKAKNRLIYGIIGVALIIGAYAITQLIKTAMTGSAPAAPTW